MVGAKYRQCTNTVFVFVWRAISSREESAITAQLGEGACCDEESLPYL